MWIRQCGHFLCVAIGLDCGRAGVGAEGDDLYIAEMAQIGVVSVCMVWVGVVRTVWIAVESRINLLSDSSEGLSMVSLSGVRHGRSSLASAA